MLRFIFNDDRYLEATDPPARLLVAFLLIMEFPVSIFCWIVVIGTLMMIKQLVIFFKYVLVLIFISLLSLMIYTNALFSVVAIADSLTSYSRLGWLDAAFCVALLCSVAFWLPLYVLAAGVGPMFRLVLPFHDSSGPDAAKPVKKRFHVKAAVATVAATVALFLVHWDVYGQHAALVTGYDLTSGWAMDASASLACRVQKMTSRSRARCAGR